MSARFTASIGVCAVDDSGTGMVAADTRRRRWFLHSALPRHAARQTSVVVGLPRYRRDVSGRVVVHWNARSRPPRVPRAQLSEQRRAALLVLVKERRVVLARCVAQLSQVRAALAGSLAFTSQLGEWLASLQAGTAIAVPLAGRVPNRNAAPAAAPSTVRAGRQRRPVMPQSAGGARAQRVLSAAAQAMAGAVIVRVSQSTDTPAHKRAARNVLERATAAGLVHTAAPARPKRNRGLDSALAAASDATSVGPAGRSVPGEGRSPRVRSDSGIHDEPAASNAEGAVSRDGAELGEGRGSAEISHGKRVRRSLRLLTR